MSKMAAEVNSLNQRTDQPTERSEKEYSERYEESNKGDDNENNEIGGQIEKILKHHHQSELQSIRTAAAEENKLFGTYSKSINQFTAIQKYEEMMKSTREKSANKLKLSS